jgi:hypothetical protein
MVALHDLNLVSFSSTLLLCQENCDFGAISWISTAAAALTGGQRLSVIMATKRQSTPG